jgi:hypothetical protein
MRKSRIVAKARSLDRQLADAIAELKVLRAMTGLNGLPDIADDIGPPGSVRTCGVSLGDGRADIENSIVRLPATVAQPYRFKVFSDRAQADALARRLCHAGV